ncbi:gliding motility-associated C-terminal domain-containing protein [Flavobacterium cerinum]|uniref:Gliding motility-associated C-terminal domain-containing protein n=1 Tax=Flavobacterium cerinum TaxID=2502784 RepID=A0A444GL44_9FLAO|nr:gliding motility-associated C-terminal domain-containing protein [Flavobacterium cerinum]RWW91646.1 gliding motility-associated C-terminal domain-containing protein [Flavobacterium cerinum]
MKKIFTLLILFTVAFLNAQIIPQIQWEKSLGSESNDGAGGITVTADGGYIVFGNVFQASGTVTTHYGASDYWIAKLNATGTLEWEKTYGGSSFEGTAAAGLRLDTSKIRQTPDGGYILGANSSSTDGDISANIGGTDVWLVKIDNSGTIEWQKNYGTVAEDAFFDIKVTNDGGFIMTNGTSDDETYVYGSKITKLDAQGNIEWTNSYGGGAFTFSHLLNIIQTSDGGYISTGWTNAEESETTPTHEIFPGLNNPNGRLWVLKMDASGTFEWAKAYGGTSIEEGYSIAETAEGNFVVAGMTYSGDGDAVGHPDPDNASSQWVLKLDNAGAILWQKTLGVVGNAVDVKIMPDGNYVIGGSYITYVKSTNGEIINGRGGTDEFLMKLNQETGDIIWTKTMGGTLNDNLWGFALTPDGGFITIGSSRSTDDDITANIGGFDYWVVKLGPDCITPILTAEIAYSVCTGNELTLTAQSEGNTINWYSSETATDILFTGSDFVTPILTGNVSYWVESASPYGCSSERKEITITVSPITSAVVEFSYVGAVCKSGNNPTPIVDNDFVWGGTFNAPTGLSIDPLTGEIDLSLSSAGTYTVTYTVQSSGCTLGNSDSAVIIITNLSIPIVSFSYGEICTKDINAYPVLNNGFANGGTFSSSPGLSIDAITGEIDVENSKPGIYVVVYQVKEDNSSCLAAGKFESEAIIKICQIQKGISPNGDGLNDWFDLTGIGVRNIGIYNRYGREVYSRSNYIKEWGGLDSDGKELPDGTYYYAIEKTDGEKLTGWIYINRNH